jgi:hypothetical protein
MMRRMQERHAAMTGPAPAFPRHPLITLKAMPQFFDLAGKGM